MSTSTSSKTLNTSINDLKDLEFSGGALDMQQKAALENFDRYRIQYLNASSSEEEFSGRYLEMQAKANLSPYQEFLSPPYSNHSLKN